MYLALHFCPGNLPHRRHLQKVAERRHRTSCGGNDCTLTLALGDWGRDELSSLFSISPEGHGRSGLARSRGLCLVTFPGLLSSRPPRTNCQPRRWLRGQGSPGDRDVLSLKQAELGSEMRQPEPGLSLQWKRLVYTSQVVRLFEPGIDNLAVSCGGS